MTRQQIHNVGNLPPRQRAVLTAMANGHNRRSAGAHLYMSESTVANCLKETRQRLRVHTTAHAVAIAVAAGVVQVGEVTP